MTENSNEVGRELGWDDEIANDGNDFTLLPAGDYPFTVTSYERERHAGSEKLPPCNKAIVYLKVDGGTLGTTTVKHNLFLHTKTEGLLCQFFTGIGQRQHGDKATMNWSTVVGSTGRAKLEVHSFVNDKGETIEINRVKKFYAPEAPAAAAFTPGAF
jgi:hypothetical protein